MPPYSCVIAPESLCKHASDEDNFVLGFDAVLASGQEISSIDSATIEVAAGDDGSATLEVSGESPTSQDYTTSKGQDIPSGRGVLFVLSSGTPGVTYKVTFVVTTDGGAVRGGACYVEVME